MSIALNKNQGLEPPEFEEGRYTLQVQEIELAPDNLWQGKPRPQIVWKFDVFGCPGLEQVRGYTSLSYFEGGGNRSLKPSKLYEWCKVFGVAPSFDEDETPALDEKNYVGTLVEALVEKNSKGWPKVAKLYKVVREEGVEQRLKDAFSPLENTKVEE